MKRWAWLLSTVAETPTKVTVILPTFILADRTHRSCRAMSTFCWMFSFRTACTMFSPCILLISPFLRMQRLRCRVPVHHFCLKTKLFRLFSNFPNKPQKEPSFDSRFIVVVFTVKIEQRKVYI